MHKYMDPNFVPCFFLKSSFFYQKREIGRVARKSIHKKWTQEEQRKNTGNLTQSKLQLAIYCYSCYTLSS